MALDTHLGPTGWILGLYSWKESNHSQVFPLGCLRSPSLKEILGMSLSNKKFRTSLFNPFRIQLVHYSWNSHWYILLQLPKLGHPIFSLPALVCYPLYVWYKEWIPNPTCQTAMSQSAKYNCLWVCLDRICQKMWSCASFMLQIG